jgi:hypothetical protein
MTHIQQIVIFSILIGLIMAAIVIIVVKQAREIRNYKRHVQGYFPAPTVAVYSESIIIGWIIKLLERMKDQLMEGDFKLLIQQANELKVVKENGEISYMYGLKKVIFTKLPYNGKQF